VTHDYLLDHRQAKAGSLRFGREERRKEARKRVLWNTRPVVDDAYRDVAGRLVATCHGYRGRDSASVARLDAVANQIAERLAQQDLVAFDDSKRTIHRD
jgi:hypothetical protein